MANLHRLRHIRRYRFMGPPVLSEQEETEETERTQTCELRSLRYLLFKRR